jgi:hypothetical protein
LQFRPVDVCDGHHLRSLAASTTAARATALTRASTPAASGVAVAGIPPLGGNATDLKTAPEIPASTGQPPTQLLTQNIVVGTGPTARPTDTVNVRYVGALYDGTPFDSSWSRGDTPISFPLNQVVPGFAQGIDGMAPGRPPGNRDPTRAGLWRPDPRPHPGRLDPGLRGGPRRDQLTASIPARVRRDGHRLLTSAYAAATEPATGLPKA